MARARTSDDGAFSYFTLQDLEGNEVEYVVPTPALSLLIGRLSEVQMEAARAKKTGHPRKLKSSQPFSPQASWTSFQDEHALPGPGFQVGLTARPDNFVAVHVRVDQASLQLLLPLPDARNFAALIEQTADALEQRDVKPIKS